MEVTDQEKRQLAERMNGRETEACGVYLRVDPVSECWEAWKLNCGIRPEDRLSADMELLEAFSAAKEKLANKRERMAAADLQKSIQSLDADSLANLSRAISALAKQKAEAQA